MKRVHPRNAAPIGSASRRSRRFVVTLAVVGIISLTVAAIAAYGFGPKHGKDGEPAAGHAAQSTAAASTAPASFARVRTTKAGKKQHPARRHKPFHRKPDRPAAQPKIVNGNPIHHPAPGTGGNTPNDDYHPAGKASEADAGSGSGGVTNPCALVTPRQARAITGKRVVAKFAPLGPTCVYQVGSSKAQITVAIELAVFSKLKAHIRNLSAFKVDGHTAYCGVYGSRVTYVLMGRDRILAISGPCSVGAKFAAVATPRLAG